MMNAFEPWLQRSSSGQSPSHQGTDASKRARVAPAELVASQEDSCADEGSIAAMQGLSDPSCAYWQSARRATPSLCASGDLSCSEADVFCQALSQATDDDELFNAQSSTPLARSPSPDAQPAPPAVDAQVLAMLRVLCDAEAASGIDPSYLTHRHGPSSSSAHLEERMRESVVGWMVEVCAEFQLHQDTLHLAASLLDRFLSATRAVPRRQLQLVAVACLLVSAKHEEEMHPSVVDLVNIADNSFRVDDLLRMESLLLSALSFRVAAPTALTFLCLIKGAVGMAPRTYALAAYLTELALLEYSLLGVPKSHLALAAAALAAAQLGDVAVLAALPPLVPGARATLAPCAHRLLCLQLLAPSQGQRLTAACPHLPIHDKFCAANWHAVATLSPPRRLPSLLDHLTATWPITSAPGRLP